MILKAPTGKKSVKSDFAERIMNGLNRASIITADRWALEYRMMGHPYPGKWTFDNHPWLRQMHTLQTELTVGMKAAQTGYTEWALNVSLFTLDVLRMDVLYVLPTVQPDASRFSSSRFDKALELSDHLKGMFTDTMNVGHKRAGTTNMFIGGSNSDSSLKSLPVSVLILDELEEMCQENIPLAKKRVSGQIYRRILELSTPKVHGSGIHVDFELSTQNHWHFRCPCCSKFIELQFPDNVVVCGEYESDPDIARSHYICNECKNVLPLGDKKKFIGEGQHVPRFPGRTIDGYHVNQLYSMHLPPEYIAAEYHKSLKDPAAEQEFWNSSMGLPHVVKDFQLHPDQVDACRGEYQRIVFDRQNFVTMGADIGKKIHVEVTAWDLGQQSGYDVNSYARARVLNYFELDDFEQLDTLMFQFGVRFAIVDCQPEKRKALEFANRFPGRVKLCRYPVGVSGRNLSTSKEEDMIVHVDRTSWLDLALGRFRNATITIPKNTDNVYVKHMIAQARIPYKDSNGNTIAKYTTPHNLDDHYAHARVYSEVALPFALGVGTHSNITG